ncbi:hypothetical protein BC828DRAFT_24071 [Blastocladiella britannica]|nr:hypothetical protein BC828DRAFT_24071 [Blastocladiella britannica]
MVASQISGANAANPAAVFVVAALEKLLATKEIKKLPKLRDSSTASLAALRALLDNAASDTQRAQSVLTPQVMRKMLEPLQMACASRAPALIAVALDCIAKLFSYNVLTDPTATTAAAAAAASAMYHPDDADASLHDFSAPTPASPKPASD